MGELVRSLNPMNPSIVHQPEIQIHPGEDLWFIDKTTWKEQKLEVWETLVALLRNYIAAAKDVLRIVPDIDIGDRSNVSVNPWVRAAGSHLQYFYKSIRDFREAYHTLTPEQAAARSGLPDTSERRTPEETTLVAEEDQLRVERLVFKLLKGLRVYLTHIMGHDFDPESPPLSLTNHDIVELAIQAKYLSLAEPQRPKNLSDLQAMLKQTNLFLACTNPDRGGEKYWKSGLPTVVFICLGHDTLQVGCNRVHLCHLEKLQNAVKLWREARFSNETRRKEILDAGKYVCTVFDNLKQRHNWSIPAANPSQYYSDIINTVHEDLSRQDGNEHHKYAFDHSKEVGRAFLAHGKEIFKPISRCWKCRFIHLYVTEEDSFEPEDPSPRNLRANLEGRCAEDLCHYFCSEMLPKTQTRVAPSDVRLSLTVHEPSSRSGG